MTTTNGNNNGTDRIDLLLDQMGRLTELVAQTNISITAGFSELKAISQAQQQDINRLIEVTAQQQQDINRLVEVTDRQAKTVDKLAESTAQQAKTAAGQGKTVDRLALMLERLMSDRGQNN